MAATVMFPSGVEATADGHAWRCEDALMKQALNTLLTSNGPGGDDPNPDYTLAQRAVDWLGGTITAFDETDGDEIRFPKH